MRRTLGSQRVVAVGWFCGSRSWREELGYGRHRRRICPHHRGRRRCRPPHRRRRDRSQPRSQDGAGSRSRRTDHRERRCRLRHHDRLRSPLLHAHPGRAGERTAVRPRPQPCVRCWRPPGSTRRAGDAAAACPHTRPGLLRSPPGDRRASHRVPSERPPAGRSRPRLGRCFRRPRPLRTPGPASHRRRLLPRRRTAGSRRRSARGRGIGADRA